MKPIALSLASAALVMAAARFASEGVYTSTQAGRGQSVYLEECAKCHGQNLGGGEDAPALAGAEFLNKWRGKTAGDLFDRIMATMPEDDPGSLSRRKCADITAFMLSANDYPPGAKDLDSGAEALNEIRLDPKK